MPRNYFVLFLFFLFYNKNLFAQLQSPEQYLGYKIGTHYTPHWRIVEYFRHVATAAPAMVKLQAYGQTNEGRPLIAAFISSSNNISNLEAIRTNNLRLAHQAADKTAGSTVNAPALVWLSYNVHGDETSSSEAAMLTLYALADGANMKTKSWLQNTVVIIDPCLNPDGRDRYVNWFLSVSGKQYNPQPQAREHSEPWPSARTNHYYFDLNRDWAWQTQSESRQRVKLYNEWLPQIHVDFHEMDNINLPYYFPPAARPYHEVITKWQRDFQTVVGRNHARYFDEQGWLYFTREQYDLLYPSYGDTYPTFTGAVGMTYEQAGGTTGGASVITSDGDTLTLVDRAAHHYTSSLSTIEVASQHAQKLISEFQNYYRTAVSTGVDAYKAYIIKYNANDAERIGALLELLRNNKIQYGTGKPANLRGFNYDTGKEDPFPLAESDIIIPTVQPRSALIKTLFEPNTVVEDSVTYDITAWSLPYVYGVKAYATRQSIPIAITERPVATVNNPAVNAYGYVLRWNGIQSAKLAAGLMQKGIRVRFNEQAFEAGGQQFSRGAVIILKASNQYYAGLWDTVRRMANAYQVQLTPISSGFVEKGYDLGSSHVHSLKARKIALITGEGISSNGVGEVWHFFDQELSYPITLINASDLNRVNWQLYDVLIMPDGVYTQLSGRLFSEQLRNWINNGGNIVALEGAITQLSKLDWTIKAKKLADDNQKNPYDDIRIYENRERDIIRGITPGSIYRVELDNTHPLAFGYPDYYYTLKQNDAIYDFMRGGGWNVGVLKKGKQVAGFVGSRLENRLQDGLLFGVQEVGKGTITYLTDNLLFRNFWENGKLMFFNAVFLVGQ